MALPNWLAVRLKLLIENWLTPALCGAGVAAYQALAAKWPVIAEKAHEYLGLDGAMVNGAIVAAMAVVANLVDRRWSKPTFQPKTAPEALPK